MAAEASAVYCTLLLSDNYLPGAMVLAHSLRDNGTKAKLAVLITPERLRAETIDELKTAYDFIVPVRPFVNATPANLWLMDRPDLIATFTKIELWRQTQFRRIVYIDCDVVAIRAPDELFSLDADFAAAPDVGWPDCFNSGVMSLRPNLQDYFALKALAERGISFDGADQGLLNMHFRNWHRLSFTYNCTPSANYQYIPAYKHFQSTISLIHFIGSQKPWNSARQVLPLESPYNQLLGRWWSIYDRHYRPASVPSMLEPRHTSTSSDWGHTTAPNTPQSQSSHWEYASQTSSGLQSVSHSVEAPQHHHTSSHHPTDPSSSGHHWEQTSQGHERHVPHPPNWSAVPQYVRGEEHVSAYVWPPSEPSAVHDHPPPPSWQQPPSEPPQSSHFGGTHNAPSQPEFQATHPPQQSNSPSPAPAAPVFEAPKAQWDASREPPPANSRPEASTLHVQTYTMSEDTQLFQPPTTYPEAPKDMYYQVPAVKPEPKKLAHIFPWETRASRPTRVFPQEEPIASATLPQQSPTPSKDDSGSSEGGQASWASEETDSWQTYSRMNAWDEVPEIQQYIQAMQRPKKGKTQVLYGGTSSTGTTSPGTSSTAGPEGLTLRITDFPSEVERPSLPVTPAPIRRPSVWNQNRNQDQDDDDLTTGEEEEEPLYPTAEGVPSQEDWNPLARLENLRRLSEALEKVVPELPSEQRG